MKRFSKRYKLLLNLLICFVCLVAPATLAGGILEVPDAKVRVPELIKEESVSTYIPSSSTGDEGLAVNIILPEHPRYADGAPVCVIAPAGDGPSTGLTFTMHSAQAGFIEVRFAFPGGGVEKFMSGGIADHRGAQSQAALKDVLLFAAGKLADTKGRKISQLAGIPVSPGNVGLVGWSNGGNIALVTLDRYADQLKFVSYLAFYESPVGTLFFPPNLGSIDDVVVNTHYREGSAATGVPIVDYSTLRFDPDFVRKKGVLKKMGETEIRGLLYFDDNLNRTWDEVSEFAFHFATDVGLNKQIYPPEALSFLEKHNAFVAFVDDKPEFLSIEAQKKLDKEEAELKKHKRIKKWPVKRVVKWPKTLSSVRLSEAYFRERDGSQSVANVCKQYPQLLLMLVATQVDHIQRQPDHPHVAYLYNAILSNKPFFVKLNPEPAYCAALAEMSSGNFKNNEVNAIIDAASLPQSLLPEGVTKDYVFMEAAVAELADRVHTHSIKSNLAETLCKYKNSKAYVKPVQAKKEPGK